jgi:hypothetical protein
VVQCNFELVTIAKSKFAPNPALFGYIWALDTMSDYDEPPDIDMDDMIGDAEEFDESKYTASGLKQSCLTCGFICMGISG